MKLDHGPVVLAYPSGKIAVHATARLLDATKKLNVALISPYSMARSEQRAVCAKIGEKLHFCFAVKNRETIGRSAWWRVPRLLLSFAPLDAART